MGSSKVVTLVILMASLVGCGGGGGGSASLEEDSTVRETSTENTNVEVSDSNNTVLIENSTTKNTYAVSGSVSGLSGTLVLQNISDDNLTISANGTYSFSAEFEEGADYNVSVQTQPSTQTCVVSNASGTFGNTAVPDVSVTCTTNTYAVGGSVSGLSGTIVLQNNSGDDLTISADVTISFSTEVAHGENYSVSVLTQPDNQYCRVSNGSGIVNGLIITDVAINCFQWALPTNLSDNISPDTQDGFNPQVAMDNSGNTIIVWFQSDGVYNQIYMSEYRNGSWTSPADLSDNISPDNQAVTQAKVAMDDNGNAVIVWRQQDGTHEQIFMSEYRNGSWTHPTGLSDNISPDGQDVLNPQLTMDNNGNTIIVWQQSDVNNEQIFMSEYRNGSWSHPTGLSDNISLAGQEVFNPQVAMDNNGNATIVWYQSDGSNNQIFLSEYRNSSWSHPASLSDNISPANEHAYDPQLAMDDNGNAVIVWYQSDDIYRQIFKSEYRNDSWTHPTSLNDYISPSAQYADSPQVAMDDNGNAVIVWRQWDGNSWQISKSEYRESNWTHPADPEDNISPDTMWAYAPQVSMSNNGNTVIVWRQLDASNEQIFMSEFRNDAWHHPTGLSDNISTDGEDAFVPQVAMDNNGKAVIVWYQSDGANDQIFMSEFK